MAAAAGEDRRGQICKCHLVVYEL